MANIEMFFDLSSPYSYLGSTQIEAVARRAQATLEMKPFVLYAVFNQSGNSAPANVPAKAVQMLRDLAAWSRDYGVPFVLNDRFPFNAMKAHRLLLAVDDPGERLRLVHRLYRAGWGENGDVTDDASLGRYLRECDLDPGLLAQVEAPEIKARLRANTEDALARGAYGAPTFFVEGEMFVGNDRLHFVERAAKGERIYPGEA